MTRWPYLLVLPGGSLIVIALAIGWLVRRARQQSVDAEIQALIKTPVHKFTGHDEALWKRTKDRREAAHKIRVRAAKVETGAPVSDILRRVK